MHQLGNTKRNSGASQTQHCRPASAERAGEGGATAVRPRRRRPAPAQLRCCLGGLEAGLSALAAATARTLPRSTVQASSLVQWRATSSIVMPRRGRPPPRPARSGWVCVRRTQSIWLYPISNGTLRRAAGAMRWCRDSTTGLPSAAPMAAALPAAPLPASPAAAAGRAAGPAASGAAASPRSGPEDRSITVAPASRGFCKKRRKEGGGWRSGVAARLPPGAAPTRKQHRLWICERKIHTRLSRAQFLVCQPN
jgi:hypothetical protein